MKNTQRKNYLSTIMVLAVLLLSILSGYVISSSIIKDCHNATEEIVSYYEKNIFLQLQKSLNDANSLASIVQVAGEDSKELFESKATLLLEKEEVVFTALFDNEHLVSALPKEQYEHLEGMDLRNFSYVYTLPMVVKNFVVEGPVYTEKSDIDKEVYLFLQPIMDNDTYLGEAVVALEKDHVQELFELDKITEQGYDYELWHVDLQSGNKKVIAVSANGKDFSKAVKTTFYMPTQWVLSIQPSDGWVTLGQKIGISVFCIALAGILITLYYITLKLHNYRKKEDEYLLIDSKTGLYSRVGFMRELKHMIEEKNSISLYYLVFKEYTEFFQILGEKEENSFLQEIGQKISDYTQSPFIAGRLGAGNFILAVIEEMSDVERENFAKGLVIEIMMKTRYRGKRRFLTADYRCESYKTGELAIEDVVDELIYNYYNS